MHPIDSLIGEIYSLIERNLIHFKRKEELK